MKTARTAIFDLIDALSSSEKAYFKKFAYKYDKDETALHFLFDCVVKVLDKSVADESDLEIYIKKKFHAKFPDTDFIKTKHQLFNLLLDSLRSFSKKHQADEYYFESISKSNILSDKNLFPSAIKILEKSLKNSKVQELPYMELLILFKINLLYIKTGELDQVEHNLNEQLDALKGVESKIKYAIKYDKVYQIFRTKGILNANDLEAHQVLDNVKHELATWDISQANGKTVFNHYMVNQLIAYVKGDSVNSLKFSEKAYKIAKENFFLFKGREVFIYGILSNLMNDSLLQGDFSYFDLYLQDLKKNEQLNENVIIHNKIQCVKIELKHCILTNRPEKALSISKAYDELDKYANTQNKINIRSSLINAFFLINDFKKTNHQLAILIELLKDEHRQEDELKIELLQLIVYIESHNFELLEYRLRSFENRLKQESQLHASYQLLFKLIKEIMLDMKMNKILFNYSELEEALMESNFDNEITSFSFLSWVEAKRKGISYSASFQINKLTFSNKT